MLPEPIDPNDEDELQNFESELMKSLFEPPQMMLPPKKKRRDKRSRVEDFRPIPVMP